MIRYVAMWNMPGCLPEMEPMTFDSFDEARQAIEDELLAQADNYSDDDDKALTPLFEAEAAIVGQAIEPFCTSPQPDGYVYSVEVLDVEDDGSRMDEEHQRAKDGP